MSNFTIEEYKTAIRAEYKKAMDEDMSGILSDPTPAQLRDFYLRLFEKGLSSIDEEIFKIFLEANENFSLKKTIENCNIGKLKPIISFLKGNNTENRARIEMAAILVNFKARPYNHFKSSREPEILQKVENEDVIDSENSKEVERETVSEEVKPEPISLFVNVEENSLKQFSKKRKQIALGIGLALVLLFVFFYFKQASKQCMQWSQDHYEIVDCDLNNQGFVTLNNVEVLDPSAINLRKIIITDTTTCFDKNGNAIIWYAKANNGVDYFNTHGRHPENGKSLKPVTDYILTKYKK